MVRKKSRIYALLFVLLCFALFGVYRLFTDRGADHTAPVITVPEEPLRISVSAEDADLLAGITAEDRRDGDVTDSLLVERVSDISADHRAEVTVAAFDGSGNVAKAKRTIEYEDYSGPRFTMSGPLRFWEKSKIDVFSLIGAEDAIDGTLDDRVKGTLIEGGTSISQPGEYLVEFRVTNSLGDTAYLKLPVEVYSENVYVFKILLDEYIVYLKPGEKLDPKAHLLSVSLGDRTFLPTELPAGAKLKIESDLDPQVPGVYQITYTVEMDQYKGCTRLVAVVEE